MWQGRGPGRRQGLQRRQISNRSANAQPIYSMGFIAISYVLGRVLGARVVKTNDTQSLGGGTHNVPEGISARGRSLSIGREQMTGLLGGDQAIQQSCGIGRGG